MSSWDRYGYCPICGAKIGEPCQDLRKALDSFTLSRPAKKRPHSDRSLTLSAAAGKRP